MELSSVMSRFVSKILVGTSTNRRNISEQKYQLANVASDWQESLSMTSGWITVLYDACGSALRPFCLFLLVEEA